MSRKAVLDDPRGTLSPLTLTSINTLKKLGKLFDATTYVGGPGAQTLVKVWLAYTFADAVPKKFVTAVSASLGMRKLTSQQWLDILHSKASIQIDRLRAWACGKSLEVMNDHRSARGSLQWRRCVIGITADVVIEMDDVPNTAALCELLTRLAWSHTESIPKETVELLCARMGVPTQDVSDMRDQLELVIGKLGIPDIADADVVSAASTPEVGASDTSRDERIASALETLSDMMDADFRQQARALRTAWERESGPKFQWVRLDPSAMLDAFRKSAARHLTLREESPKVAALPHDWSARVAKWIDRRIDHITTRDGDVNIFGTCVACSRVFPFTYLVDIHTAPDGEPFTHTRTGVLTRMEHRVTQTLLFDGLRRLFTRREVLEFPLLELLIDTATAQRPLQDFFDAVGGLLEDLSDMSVAPTDWTPVFQILAFLLVYHVIVNRLEAPTPLEPHDMCMTCYMKARTPGGGRAWPDDAADLISGGVMCPPPCGMVGGGRVGVRM